MKVYIVIEHQDQYETGPITMVTSDKETALKEERKHSKLGFYPKIEEWDVEVTNG